MRKVMCSTGLPPQDAVAASADTANDASQIETAHAISVANRRADERYRAARHLQPATRNRLPRGLMSTGQLAAFAVLVGTYCLASVLAGFWLAHNNRRKP